VPSRFENKDSNGEVFGGNSLFREITQEPDGTLNTKFPAEMVPETGKELKLTLKTDLDASLISNNSIAINAPGAVGSAHLQGLPYNCKITMEIEPVGLNEEYGLILQSNDKAKNGYGFTIDANNRTVSLGDTKIAGVTGLNKAIKLTIVMKDGILDADIDGRRTIVNRTYDQHGKVAFKSIKISPIIEND
jgi:hypothetical protein